jgi:hypothetical protein
MDQIQRSHLIPLQREAFLCSARCCDAAQKATTSSGAEAMRSLQECAARCSQPVQAAQQVSYGAVEDFQARFQRCAARCQDLAREELPSGAGAPPSAKAVAQAEEKMRACLERTCADEFLGKVGKMKADIEAGLKQIANARR